MNITIDVIGVAEVESLFSSLEGFGKDSVLDQAGAVLLNRIRARFLRQVDTTGVPWKVSEAAKIRRRKGRGGGTLFDTGKLFHSISLSKTGVGERAIGTDVEYAKYHQRGIGQENREFIGINSDDLGVVLKLLRSRLRAIVK